MAVEDEFNPRVGLAFREIQFRQLFHAGDEWGARGNGPQRVSIGLALHGARSGHLCPHPPHGDCARPAGGHRGPAAQRGRARQAGQIASRFATPAPMPIAGSWWWTTTRCSRHEPGDLGDVHALRPARGHRGAARLPRIALDPMAYSHDDPRNAKIVIDACKPWARRDTFPNRSAVEQGTGGTGAGEVCGDFAEGDVGRSGLRSLGWRSAALPLEQTAPRAGNPGAALPIGR